MTKEREHIPFPKIPRLSKRELLITEKIDGTNACIRIYGDGEIVLQSRNRIISTEYDNYGFAAWVNENREAILGLGPGVHFGEWWGNGIQHGYGLSEKRFSLFDALRWTSETQVPPAICGVVPVLYYGEYQDSAIEDAVAKLTASGSLACPGYGRPEGVVVKDCASGSMHKVIINSPNKHKWELAK